MCDDFMLRPQVRVSRSVTTGRVPAEAGCEGPGQLHPTRCVGAQRRQPRRPLRRLSQPQRRRQSECHGANSEDPFPYFGGGFLIIDEHIRAQDRCRSAR